MANMFDMPMSKKKACPIMSAGIASALMSQAINEEYKSIVLQDEEAIVGLGLCSGDSSCAWWDDSRQCCGVISK